MKAVSLLSGFLLLFTSNTWALTALKCDLWPGNLLVFSGEDETASVLFLYDLDHAAKKTWGWGSEKSGFSVEITRGGDPDWRLPEHRGVCQVDLGDRIKAQLSSPTSDHPTWHGYALRYPYTWVKNPNWNTMPECQVSGPQPPPPGPPARPLECSVVFSK